MNHRTNVRTAWLFGFAAVFTIVTVLAILFFDRPLAEFVHRSGWEDAWLFVNGTTLLDTIFGKTASKFLLGFALIVIGAGLLFKKPTRPFGFPLLFIGSVQFSSTLLSGVAKNLFGRLRPYELLAGGNWDDAWFAGGSAFPSGHAGFYFGLFLPLVFLYPRWRWPLLAVPFFIALARIDANDHSLSDVTASMALAAAVTWALAVLMRRRLNDNNLAAPPARG